MITTLEELIEMIESNTIYKVFVTHHSEYSTIARLLFKKSKRQLLKLSDEDYFVKTYYTREKAMEFIKRCYSYPTKEEHDKECMVMYVFTIYDNQIENIERYNHRLELVEKIY